VQLRKIDHAALPMCGLPQPRLWIDRRKDVRNANWTFSTKGPSNLGVSARSRRGTTPTPGSREVRLIRG